MAEKDVPKLDRVRITVTAAASHPDVLSVRDAMRQVLDFFDLLTPEDDDGFLWNLKLATTNSPLTVEGEAFSVAGDANAVAGRQTLLVGESLKALSEGRLPRRHLSSKRRETVRRIMKRNMNGIGKTEAIFARAEPVYVTPSIAETTVRTLERNDFDALVVRDRARDEHGSLEGTLVQVGSDYNRPSVIIKERRTGAEISCRVSEELRDSISDSMSIKDVWANKRVIVRGRIRYNSDGTILRVIRTEAIRALDIQAVNLEALVDPTFTSGLSTADYLEKLREGDFGQAS